jgi:hypothetical protein
VGTAGKQKVGGRSAVAHAVSEDTKTMHWLGTLKVYVKGLTIKEDLERENVEGLPSIHLFPILYNISLTLLQLYPQI